MLTCLNPICGGRKRRGFTATGLRRHFSQFRACEHYFLSSPSVSLRYGSHVNPASASINAFRASSLAGFNISREGFPSPESAQEVMNDNDLVDDDNPLRECENSDDNVLLPPDDDSSVDAEEVDNEDDVPFPLFPRTAPEDSNEEQQEDNPTANDDDSNEREAGDEAYPDTPSNVYDPSVPNTVSPKQWIEQWLS